MGVEMCVFWGVEFCGGRQFSVGVSIPSSQYETKPYLNILLINSLIIISQHAINNPQALNIISYHFLVYIKAPS